jgi:hypothetical protein
LQGECCSLAGASWWRAAPHLVLVVDWTPDSGCQPLQPPALASPTPDSTERSTFWRWRASLEGGGTRSEARGGGGERGDARWSRSRQRAAGAERGDGQPEQSAGTASRSRASSRGDKHASGLTGSWTRSCVENYTRVYLQYYPHIT